MAYPDGTLEQKKALQKSASIKVVLAILMSVGSVAIMAAGASAAATPTDSIGVLGVLGIIIRVAALVPWFWGLADYCRSKGQSPVLAVLGLLSCIGLIILVVLPDKYVIRTSQGYDPNSNYPR